MHTKRRNLHQKAGNSEEKVIDFSPDKFVKCLNVDPSIPLRWYEEGKEGRNPAGANSSEPNACGRILLGLYPATVIAMAKRKGAKLCIVRIEGNKA